MTENTWHAGWVRQVSDEEGHDNAPHLLGTTGIVMDEAKAEVGGKREVGGTIRRVEVNIKLPTPNFFSW